MSTPVESLFNPQKPSGKFLNDDELRQIRDNIDYLSVENKKLVDMVQQYQSQLNSVVANQNTMPTVVHTPAHTPAPTPGLTPAPTPAPRSHEDDDRIYHGNPVPIGNKSVTIIVDTNKMVYLLLFILLVIIILKK